MPEDISLYFDYAAATPLDDRVFEAMKPYFSERFFNPSASYQAARQVKFAIDEARQKAGKVIGVKAHEIIFTAGATESINLAIAGVCNSYQGNIVTTPIEHDAVLQAATAFEPRFAAVDGRGYVTPEAVRDAIDDETVLVSVGYINNELGTVQPLKDIAAMITKLRQDRLRKGNQRPLLLHTDASQAAGLLSVMTSRLGVDLMTLNGGKCYGPKQTGLLWYSPHIKLAPLIVGGGQEQGLRSGTENVAGVIGFSEALEIAEQERKTESARITAQRDKLEKAILERITDCQINGHPKRRAPHIIHLSFSGIDGERLLFALDEKGLMAATGSACAANKHTRSHVLSAVGMSDELADGSLRLSLGRFTTDDEIDRAVEIIAGAVEQERELS